MLVTTFAFAMDCPRMFDTEEVLVPVAAAEEFYRRGDREGLEGARTLLHDRLACLEEILAPAAIARVHRVEAVSAALGGDGARAQLALAGVFAAEPGHQIPATLIAESDALRQRLPMAMLALRDDQGVDLPNPAHGWIEVDGIFAHKAPTQRAALLQQVDGDGGVVATHYRWPEEEGFHWVAGELGPTVPLATRSVDTTRTLSPWARRAPLLAASGAVLAASGVLYALAADGRAAFDQMEPLDAGADSAARQAYQRELETMQGATNGLTYGFFVAGGLGLAVGAVAVITW